MTSNAEDPIPEARVDDLDLDDERDRAIWEERLRSLAERRLAQARSRLERKQVIDERGELTSEARLPDMLPSTETSVETG